MLIHILTMIIHDLARDVEDLPEFTQAIGGIGDVPLPAIYASRLPYNSTC